MENILVIDDNYGGTQQRSNVYEKVLRDKFNVKFVEGSGQWRKTLDDSADDLYIVDVVLKNWIDPFTSKPVNTIEVLRKLKEKRKPIILISSEYETLVKDNQLPGFINQIIQEGIYISTFITWGQFTEAYLAEDKERQESITCLIEYEILRNKKIREKKREENIPVGIITALSEELNPFLANLKQPLKPSSSGLLNFQIGEITTKDGKTIPVVCACQDRMGMVDCALIASAMINKFKVKHLFMIGVCGGRDSEKVNIGDIIIPSECIAYQSGKIGSDGLVPDIGVASASGGLQQKLNPIKNDIAALIDEIFKQSQDNHLKKHGSYLSDVKAPTVRFEEMACGDVIINKEGLLDEIAKQTAQRKLCSVEMESYSILRSHYYFPEVHSTVIKCVMDLTKQKSDKFKEYAAFIAANFLFRLLHDGIYEI